MKKFICDFVYEDDAIENAIEVAGFITKRLLLDSLFKGSIKNIQNSNGSTRGTLTLISAAVGLLRLGFDKEKVLAILRDAFKFEFNNGDVSPGNDEYIN